MRVIDRQKAIDTLCDNCDKVQAVCAHYPCKQYIALENLLSLDAVEVVRCKDCKNWDRDWESSRDRGNHYCWMNDLFTYGEFFCSDAERIEK